MTIDRTARDQMAELLRHFVTGSVTNFSFEDKIPSSEDPVISAIGGSMWYFYDDDCEEYKLDNEHALWYFYDDCEEHGLDNKHAIPKEMKKVMARWIMFLYSDEEYKWPSISGPGVRPFRPPGIFYIFFKLLGGPAKQKKFMSYGDYDVWPFIDEESFNNEKENPKLLNSK